MGIVFISNVYRDGNKYRKQKTESVLLKETNRVSNRKRLNPIAA